MSRASMEHSIAHDIHDGVMTREEAITEFEHLFDEFERT